MNTPISVDRFTRQKQTISGAFAPREFERLAEFLAGDDGEIQYLLAGNVETDAAGSLKRRIKCIISGWFFLADPVTLKPVRHDINIESRLVLVASEADLPPLEMEADDEDYIVCGSELDAKERVEEEILLDLPGAYSAVTGQAVMVPQSAKGKVETKVAGRTVAALPPVTKISPFAKLADLKKK
jgi:uncharacterized protein